MTWLRRFAYWRPPCLLRAVIVNLKSDSTTAIRGVLWSSRGAWLTVKEPAALRPNGAPAAPIDGEVVIHRDNIAFLQVLPHADQ